jgi:hypothetical protein
MKLTKIKLRDNEHSYVNDTNPATLYGQRSACVMQFDDGGCSVEYRDGARFLTRHRYATAREAIAAAKDGNRVAKTMTGGAGWNAAMADQLYNTPVGAFCALQDYIDRCHRRGIRPNLERFMHAHTTQTAAAS